MTELEKYIERLKKINKSWEDDISKPMYQLKPLVWQLEKKK